MHKLKAISQILVGGLLAVAAAATLINLLFIVTRPETISVVNAMIGQGVIIICLAALARIMIRRGRVALGAAGAGEDSRSDREQQAGESGNNQA